MVRAVKSQAEARRVSAGRDLKIVFQILAGSVEHYVDTWIDLAAAQAAITLYRAPIGRGEILSGHRIGRGGFKRRFGIGSQQAQGQGLVAELKFGRVRGEGQRIPQAAGGPFDPIWGAAADVRLKANRLLRQDLAGRSGVGTRAQKDKAKKAHKIVRRGMVLYRFQFK